MTSQEFSKHIQKIDPSKYYPPRPGDPRLSETVQPISLDQIDVDDKWIIIGHPDDEGVELNRGRKGTSQAPHQFRSCLYPMVATDKRIFDAGNTDDELTLNLDQRHDLAYQASSAIFKSNRLFAIGGGHDYAYPNIKAFLDKYPEGLVINIDAHLDLRPRDPSAHSGTGFRRLFEEGYNYQLIEYGYQQSFTSKEQIDFANKHSVRLIEFNDRNTQKKSVLDAIKNSQHLFLSIDIDGFSSAIAPGASAAWPIGLQYEDFEDIFLECKTKNKMQGMAIYEVSPPLDEGNKTSQLAAQLAYQGIVSRWV